MTNKQKINILLVGVSTSFDFALAKMREHEEIIIHEKKMESFGKELSEVGLKAAEAAKNLVDVMNLVFEPMAPMPFLSEYFSGRTPWAPLHGIQAKFFRFNPKKWHTAAARFIPTGHRITYFYRRCWMQLKTFVNFRFARPV